MATTQQPPSANESFERIGSAAGAFESPDLASHAKDLPGDFVDQVPSMGRPGGVDSSLSAGGRKIVVTSGKDEITVPNGFGSRIEPGDEADVVNLSYTSGDPPPAGSNLGSRAARPPRAHEARIRTRVELTPQARRLRNQILGGGVAVLAGVGVFAAADAVGIFGSSPTPSQLRQSLDHVKKNQDRGMPTSGSTTEAQP